MTEQEVIRIEVFTKYDRERSNPDEEIYVFLYTIGITNLGSDDLQIVGRRWVLTDGNNELHEFAGEGVVGKKPVIEPNHSFSYTSGVQLDTEVGTMEGEYIMRDATGTEFHVPISKFTLSVPRLIN